MSCRESVFSTLALQKRNSFETNLGSWQISNVQGICIEGFFKLKKRQGNFIPVIYAKLLFQKNERGSAPVYLKYDYHSLFTSPKTQYILKELILEDLLFEQFFPTKPGTHVQL